jgi:hypothetical protein
MRKRRNILITAGLALAIYLVPLNNAHAHGINKQENPRIEHVRTPHQEKHKDTRNYAYKQQTRSTPRIEKKVIVHKQAPTKVVHVYDNDNTDKLIAASIAQLAMLLVLD